MTFNVSPETFTEEAFRGILSSYRVAFEGIGYALAMLDDDSGWDQSNCFDFEPCEHLLDAAMDSLRGFAKDNQLFYNNTKLEDAATSYLVAAYGDAFLRARDSRS